jgi:tetratricopeptide (TPR) repeat protein
VFALHDRMHVPLRQYLLGLISARLGDTVAALRHADSLARVPADSMQSLLALNLAGAVRARVAQRRGEPVRALAVLGEPWLDPRTHGAHRSSIFSQVADRYLRAELLREAGRLPEAIAAYGSVADYSVDGLMFLAPSLLHRAEMYERLGDRAQAATHYRRFIALWSECDPELRPTRLAAERRLAAIDPRTR